MTKGQFPLQPSAFFQNPKSTLEQLLLFIDQLYQEQQRGALAQRMGVISTLAKFLASATKVWMEGINLFRIEICFNPLQQTSKRSAARRRNSTATGNKSTRLEQTRKKQMTIDEILADAVQVSMSHTNSSIIGTPRRDPNMPNQILPTPALPQTEAISMQHLEQSSLHSPSLHIANATIEDKMITYHKLLAGEREEMNVTVASSINSTRRKRTTTSRRKVSCIRDEDIYLNEGTIKQQKIQKLSTKIKMSREYTGDPYDTFQGRLKEINPALSKIQLLRRQLAQRLRERHVQAEMNTTYIHQTEQYQPQSSIEQNFIINESNSPTITTALQSKLTHILEGALFMEPKIGFQDFCQARRITREIKGELFYQLLHMDFPLDQPHPGHFGDIFIHPR